MIRKARKWWVIGGVGIVAIGSFVWLRSALLPYHFLRGAEFHGYMIGEVKDGSGREFTITQYVVQRDSALVIREAEEELVKLGWTKKTNPASVSFSDGQTGINISSRRDDASTTSVIVSWSTRPIDRALVLIYPERD